MYNYIYIFYIDKSKKIPMTSESNKALNAMWYSVFFLLYIVKLLHLTP